jgi:hypothetical protein
VTPEQMLEALAGQGDQGSDYNDGLDGWFSWTLNVHPHISILNISWQPAGTDEPGEKTTLTWLVAGPVPQLD